MIYNIDRYIRDEAKSNNLLYYISIKKCSVCGSKIRNVDTHHCLNCMIVEELEINTPIYSEIRNSDGVWGKDRDYIDNLIWLLNIKNIL